MRYIQKNGEVKCLENNIVPEERKYEPIPKGTGRNRSKIAIILAKAFETL